MSNPDPRGKDKPTTATKASSGKQLGLLLLIALVGFVLFVAILLFLEKLGLIVETGNRIVQTPLGWWVGLFLASAFLIFRGLISRQKK